LKVDVISQILFETDDRVPKSQSGIWTDSNGCRVRLKAGSVFPPCASCGNTFWHRFP